MALNPGDYERIMSLVKVLATGAATRAARGAARGARRAGRTQCSLARGS
jgi:hypothetical protein